jgi:hypothetical protein
MVEMGALNIIYKTKKICFPQYFHFFCIQRGEASAAGQYFGRFFSGQFFFQPIFFGPIFFSDIFFYFVTNFYLMFLFWPNQKAAL